jgi:hypothetical protein
MTRLLIVNENLLNRAQGEKPHASAQGSGALVICPRFLGSLGWEVESIAED